MLLMVLGCASECDVAGIVTSPRLGGYGMWLTLLVLAGEPFMGSPWPDRTKVYVWPPCGSVVASEQTVAVYGLGGPIEVTVDDVAPTWTHQDSYSNSEINLFRAVFTVNQPGEFAIRGEACHYEAVEAPPQATWAAAPALVIRSQLVARPSFTGDVENGWFIEYSWDGETWHIAVPGGGGYLGFDHVPEGTPELFLRPSNGGAGAKSPSVAVDLTEWWAAIERERVEQALIESL